MKNKQQKSSQLETISNFLEMSRFWNLCKPQYKMLQLYDFPINDVTLNYLRNNPKPFQQVPPTNAQQNQNNWSKKSCKINSLGFC